ncbi:condensation domain-containing protein [Dactylosporangium sp. CA-092794]|uniref:condensation domain-containing protein n=1 Tax=Dactylosporangium sp. CA-092794 TaxID=3239929 RepID=UPI003D94326B
MAVEHTFPATVGQLSVWRDIEKMPQERRWEANLAPVVWDLPDGVDAETVWRALARLAMRHGSLRTRYAIGDDGSLRQWLPAEEADTEAAVLESVRQGTADAGELAGLEEREQQHAIDFMRELPWRAWLLLDGDRPAQVLLIVNHMAADGAALLVMQDDFRRLLAGEDLPPATGPLELALEQQGDEGGGRLRNAERYWRRTLATAPRAVAGGPGPERVGATIHTGIPLPQAHDAAAKLGVSLASLLIAVYHRAVCATTGERTHLMFPMSSNRFDERHAGVVTSLNQWVPLLLDLDPDEPLETAAPRAHWKTFNALKNGVCSPDAIVAIRAEHQDADPGYSYNAIIAPPGFPSADSPEPSTVEWYEPARTTGPGFYLIARGLTSLDLIMRVYRPGWDRPHVERFVESVRSQLSELPSLDI